MQVVNKEIGFLLYHLKIIYNKQDTRYFLPKVEMKNYNLMIDGQNFFDQSVKNDLKTYDNIGKTTIGLLDSYFLKVIFYKLIAIDLSKQQALDGNPKEI